MADLHLLRPLAGALGALLALLPAPPAHALEISPLRVVLATGQADGEVWLHNDSRQPWHGQARLYRWEQGRDTEQLRPAADLAVSPADLHLAPDARQRVRLVRLGPAPAAEQGYRLVLQAAADTPAVQVSLPVFVAGPHPHPAPALTARVVPGTHPAMLELHNGGHRHARLADLAFVAGNGQRQLLLPGLAGYVLAGHTRRWPLTGPAQAYRGGRFSARLGDQAEDLLALPDPRIAPPADSGL